MTPPNPEPERLALAVLTAECNACLDRLARVTHAALHARERGDLLRVRASLRMLAEQAEDRRRELVADAGVNGPPGPAVREPR